MAITIDIEDNVPLPDDGWTSSKSAQTVSEAIVKVMTAPAVYAPSSSVEVTDWQPARPSANECTFIGGPLNGLFGVIKGDAKTVEIELYNPDGSVASVELYALGDSHPTPTFRYHVGSKTL